MLRVAGLTNSLRLCALSMSFYFFAFVLTDRVELGMELHSQQPKAANRSQKHSFVTFQCGKCHGNCCNATTHHRRQLHHLPATTAAACETCR